MNLLDKACLAIGLAITLTVNGCGGENPADTTTEVPEITGEEEPGGGPGRGRGGPGSGARGRGGGEDPEG